MARRGSATVSRGRGAVSLPPAHAKPALGPVTAVSPPAQSRFTGAVENLEEIQRARLLAATAVVVDELGYAQATVASITGRARVSRRTFYELFDNRERCIAALIEDAAQRIESELAEAELESSPWQARMRAGLSLILSFLEREPVLARVCLVHTLGLGGAARERREHLTARLVAAVDEGRQEADGAAHCSELTAEGVVGALLTIVQTRLARAQHQPLTGLLSDLMAVIVLPYLGPAVARREQAQPTPTPAVAVVDVQPVAADPLADLPMRITYRTAKVLGAIGAHPGASNRQVAAHAGIHDQGQVSKLLSRLQRLGLIVNHGTGHPNGEPNAWQLSPRGAQVASSLAGHAGAAHGARVA